MSSVLPFTYKIGTTTQCPFPGAYIMVGSSGASGMVPIYTSMPSFGDSGLSEFLNDKDTQVLVLPGYSLQLYNDAAYGTLNTTADNSGGTDVLYRSASLAASSCKLFYKFRTGYAEIPSNIIGPTITVTTTASSSNFNINGITITNPVTYNGAQYRLYPFTSTGTPGSFSITDTAGIGVDCFCLLIGGGGGGGNYYTGYTIGAGGGGAGTFLTTTISVKPGYTFNVYVGDGGAGGPGNAHTAGSPGDPTYITRTVNSVIDASLTVGGGGSGGGVDFPTGKVGTYYGSTGGGYNVDARNASTAAGTAYAVTSGSTVFNNITAKTNNGAKGVGSGGGGGGSYRMTQTYRHGGFGASWTVISPGQIPSLAGGGGGSQGSNSTSYPLGMGGEGGGSGGNGGGTGIAVQGGADTTGGGGGGGYLTGGGKGGSGICIIAVPLYRLSA